MLFVLICIGVPYILLSANSSLLQGWGAHAVRGKARHIYKLYGISNMGSLMGLLVYPILIEPYLSLTVQWFGFVGLLAVYTMFVYCVGRQTKTMVEATASELSDAKLSASLSPLSPKLTAPFFWFLLPMLTTFLLNAATTHLTTDFTPIPMLWVLLLVFYLCSFILGFSKIGECGFSAWAAVGVIFLGGVSCLHGVKGFGGFTYSCVMDSAIILTVGTALHGWLYRIRPDGRLLTRYYLAIAAGGACGGVAASIFAPLLFTSVLEYPLALIGVSGMIVWIFTYWHSSEFQGLLVFLKGVAVFSIIMTVFNIYHASDEVLKKERNFYGCLQVKQKDFTSQFGDKRSTHILYHGETTHGVQAMDVFDRKKPTTYYGEQGGGLSVIAHPKYKNGQSMRVGIVGLGVGTMAVYGRTNDLYRMYEINPKVIDCATNTTYFTFLSDSEACVELVLGDARKQLEKERAENVQTYDVLVIDAYSGDSIPLHLTTKEAFQLYLDRLASDGILAMHVSNWHLDLLPLAKAVAKNFGLRVHGVVSEPVSLTMRAMWVFFSRQEMILPVNPQISRWVDWDAVRSIPLIEDQRGSLIDLIRFGIQPKVIPVDF